MVFVDSNVPMYLVGAAHPHKADAQRLLEWLVRPRGHSGRRRRGLSGRSSRCQAKQGQLLQFGGVWLADESGLG
jgi:hypothetical protein